MNPAVIAAIPVVLDLIAKLAPGFQHLISWIMGIRTVLAQDQAWTPELENAFIASLISTKTDPAYAPDPKV
jgi:hypothetical protein